jgi:hypothetical protein
MADSINATGIVPPSLPPMKAGVGMIARIPTCDTSNPADLEAWFGPFGFVDHFRKVVLGSCKEIERAKNTTASEAKLDTLSHVNDMYVDFLIQCLNGRRLREQNVLDSNRQGTYR